MKYFSFSRRIALISIVISVFGFASSAFATVPPTLQLSATGTSDNVQVTVTGDPNASVLLSYTEAGVGPTISSIGTTDGSGNFTTTISSASYGLTTGTAVTAIIGGTTGPKSPTESWPSVTSANALTLSQNAVVVSVGSSVSLSATSGSTGSLYVSNNSNPVVANVSISGNTVTVSGNTPGVTIATLCNVGNASSCPTVYITVQQSGAQTLSLSQNTVTVVEGQNLPITISGGTGSYVLQNNSNSSVIQASINGSVLTLSTGSTSGSSSITVCSSDLQTCGVVQASAGSASSAAISLSTSAPTVAQNESTTVSIYGPSGLSYYVSSNSSPSVVQANLSGTTLTLTGISQGQSTVSVCASSGTCASLTVTVTATNTGAPIMLSQTSLSVSVGQSATINVTGGIQPYTVSNTQSSIANASINGSSLTINGVTPGSATIWICSASGGCVNVAVTVGGSVSNTGTISLSPSVLSLSVGQSAIVTLSGSTSYYLSSNSGPSVATVSVSGNQAVVAGLSSGSANAVICANGGSCATLIVTVTSTAVVSPPAVTTTPSVIFTEYLAPGSQDAEVTALQTILQNEGYLNVAPTGYYGSLTEAGVMQFQAAHGIDQLGVVGPATRAALNAIENSNTETSSSGSTTNISTMSLSQLQAEVQSLEATLTQVLNRITQLSAQ